MCTTIITLLANMSVILSRLLYVTHEILKLNGQLTIKLRQSYDNHVVNLMIF